MDGISRGAADKRTATVCDEIIRSLSALNDQIMYVLQLVCQKFK